MLLTLVAGASEELTLSDWRDATAVVVKGVCFLKEESKVKFWLVEETKLIGEEWVLLERMWFLLEEIRVDWASIAVDELKVRVPIPSIVILFFLLL